MKSVTMILVYLAAGVLLFLNTCNSKSPYPNLRPLSVPIPPTKDTSVPYTVNASKGVTLALLHRDHPIIQRRLESLGLETLQPNSYSTIWDSGSLSVYYLEIDGGTPAINMLGYFDTGSSFVWFRQLRQTPSETLQQVSCLDAVCEYAPNFDCSPVDQGCTYSVTYADGSISSGSVATDTFAVRETGGHDPNRRIEFHMHFGVPGSNNQNRTLLGVVGLNGPLGLLATLQATQVSVCFPLSTQAISHARFGKDALLLGAKTGLWTDNENHLYVVVLSLRVAGTTLRHLKSVSSVGDTFTFDTAAGFTHLRAVAMDAVISAVKSYVDATPLSVDNLELCYRTEDMEAFEGLEFSFILAGGAGNVAGGAAASLTLSFNNTWYYYNQDGYDLYCLAFMRSDMEQTYSGFDRCMASTSDWTTLATGFIFFGIIA